MQYLILILTLGWVAGLLPLHAQERIATNQAAAPETVLKNLDVTKQGAEFYRDQLRNAISLRDRQVALRERLAAIQRDNPATEETRDQRLIIADLTEITQELQRHQAQLVQLAVVYDLPTVDWSKVANQDPSHGGRRVDRYGTGRQQVNDAHRQHLADSMAAMITELNLMDHESTPKGGP